MFAIIAALLFILAAFGVTMGDVNLIALGLCAMALQLLIAHGAWPFPPFPVRRRER